MGGWIKLYRDIQDHWIWQDSQRLKWWLDIVLMANHQEKKFLLGNELFEVGRGEFHTSELKLAERWGVSKNTVRRFLELLENDQMVNLKKTKKGTMIKVSNYNDYQGVFENEKTIKEPYGDHNVNTNKKEKNDKECKNEQESKKELLSVVAQISVHYEKCFRRIVVPIHIEKLVSFLEDNMELELVMHVMEYAHLKTTHMHTH